MSTVTSPEWSSDLTHRPPNTAPSEPTTSDATTSPPPLVADRTEYPIPRAGDEVIVNSSIATVMRVHNPERSTSAIDAAIYPGGRPTLLSNVEHGIPTGWAWPDEVIAFRRAELEAAARGEPVARIGGWVRFALSRFAEEKGVKSLQVVRGKIHAIETVKMRNPAEPNVRLELELFELDPPADPAIEDRPIENLQRVLAYPVDLGNTTAIETGQPGRWEFFSESNLFPIEDYQQSVFVRKDCDLCTRRVGVNDRREIDVDQKVNPLGKPKLWACSACRGDLQEFLSGKLQAREVAMKTRVIECPLRPKQAATPV